MLQRETPSKSHPLKYASCHLGENGQQGKTKQTSFPCSPTAANQPNINIGDFRKPQNQRESGNQVKNAGRKDLKLNRGILHN